MNRGGASEEREIKNRMDRNRYREKEAASITHQAGVTCMEEEMEGLEGKERRVMEVKEHHGGGRRVEVRTEKLKWCSRSHFPSLLIALLFYSLFLPLKCPLFFLPPDLHSLVLPFILSSLCPPLPPSILLTSHMETKSREKVKMMLKQ